MVYFLPDFVHSAGLREREEDEGVSGEFPAG